MSDWFTNPSSEIPDEMWRAPAPMQRQADAVVMWAELTGKHASKEASYARSAAVGAVLGGAAGGGTAAKYSKKDRKKKTLRGAAAGAAIGAASGLTGRRIRSALAGRVADQMKPGPRPGTYIAPVGLLDKFVAQKRAVKALQGAGAIGGGVLAGRAASKKSSEKKASVEKTARNEQFVNALHAIRNNPEIAGAAVGAPVGAGKAYLDYRPGKSGISKAEASLMGKIEEARVMGADKKKIDKIKKRLETAKSRRENLGRTVAMGAGIGGTAGAGMMHMAARQRGLRGK